MLVFVFYLFHATPLHWNESNLVAARTLDKTPITRELESAHSVAMRDRELAAQEMVGAWRVGDTARAESARIEIERIQAEDAELQRRFQAHLAEVVPGAETNDKDYVFITFVMDHLPVGIVGLLLAMIFCAGMGSTSAGLSSLATTSIVDVWKSPRSDAAQVRATQWATVAFGVLALGFAALFSLFENLIQAVNILGSLFYGTILGIFLVAFFVKHVQGTAVFVAALVSQAAILVIHFAGFEIAFLWYNLIAPTIVIVVSIALQAVVPRTAR